LGGCRVKVRLSSALRARLSENWQKNWYPIPQPVSVFDQKRVVTGPVDGFSSTTLGFTDVGKALWSARSYSSASAGRQRKRKREVKRKIEREKERERERERKKERERERKRNEGEKKHRQTETEKVCACVCVS